MLCIDIAHGMSPKQGGLWKEKSAKKKENTIKKEKCPLYGARTRDLWIKSPLSCPKWNETNVSSGV